MFKLRKRFWILLLLIPILVIFTFVGIINSQPSSNDIRVIDGDTIEVISIVNKTYVRLYGIDAPEKKQKFGKEAKEFLEEEIKSAKKLKIETITTDIYGRKVGIIFKDDEDLSINEKLVKNGYAEMYRSYCNIKDICARLNSFEYEAKINNIGIWSDSDRMSPYDFRRQNKKNGL